MKKEEGMKKEKGMKKEDGTRKEGATGAKAAGGAAPELVGSHGRWNWKRPDGTYVLGEWANWTKGFSRGWGCFQRKGDRKWNFVDADGRLLSGEWFDNANPFGEAEGDPASVKRGGRWHALYGRGADGAPDLSGKSVDAGDMWTFTCGMALVGSKSAFPGGVAEYGYGYVDASMDSVGPAYPAGGGDWRFPFYGATRFGPGIYGGRWAKVTLAGGAGAAGLNLMGLDGGLAFGGGGRGLPASLHAIPGGLGASCGDGRGQYAFPQSGGWSLLSRTGICERGGGAFLDGEGGRLTLRVAWDRTTGERRECLVAADSDGREHVACTLDGGGADAGE